MRKNDFEKTAGGLGAAPPGEGGRPQRSAAGGEGFPPSRATGFASPAQGYEAKSFDFNEILAPNAAATYVMKAAGNHFCADGIPQGSLLVVDRLIEPAHESFVVIAHEGEFLCRRMIVKPRGSASSRSGEIVFTDGTRELPRRDIEIFGTVRAVITLLR